MSTSLATDLLIDAFGRVHETVHAVADGASLDALTWRPAADANSISWLIWHLARVEDDHVAGVVGADQVWTAGGWYERFALPFEPGVIGYGQTSAEVAQVRVPADLLTAYYDEVHAQTVQILGRLDDADYARVVDRRWDPPVTCAVRLVSVVNDVTQHVGQAAYVRGLLP